MLRKSTEKSDISSIPASDASRSLSADLTFQKQQIIDRCTACGACRTHCAFLQKYGLPSEIVPHSDFGQADQAAMAFACSLCGLCGAVCPEKLNPTDLFLAIRRQAVADGQVDLSPYKTLLNYEMRGASRLFSYYGLPPGCRTVFFPGCTLPGTRSRTVRHLFGHLQRRIPNLGIVLDCCRKPSHDLGRQTYFIKEFDTICRRLLNAGISEVLTACPNCHAIFQEYGRELKARTVYEALHTAGFSPNNELISGGVLAVHDPCPLRKNSAAQEAVRSLLRSSGSDIEEMKHHGEKTLCCGEGGAVEYVRPDLARQWRRQRQEEAGNRILVTYCAGCAGFLNRAVPALHLLDLLFFPGKTLAGRPPVTRSPWTYVQRLRLKSHFKKIFNAVGSLQ